MREWVKKVQNANHLVVLTGAGMSTESGLPDFRSQGGLWSGRDPNEIATPGAIGTKDVLSFTNAGGRVVETSPQYRPLCVG